MATQRTLLKNGCVLSLDRNVGNFQQADVLIEGTKLAAVGPNLPVEDAEVIDASNMIVMPGFVDSHRHMWEGILRNIGTDIPLEGDSSYLAFVLNTLAPAYRPEDVYAGNLVSTLGLIDAGVTTILDWSHIQAGPDHTEAAIQALKESGLRAVFAYGPVWYEAPKPEHPDWFRQTAQRHFSSKDQLLTLGLAAFGPEFNSVEGNVADWQLARECDARITVHVGVGTFGKHGKVGEVGRTGIYGPDTTFIHCTTLSDEEIQMIVDSGATISLACPVEMMMGHGLPPTQRFIDRGLKPSLSVDVETNVPNDMFTQMRSVISLQHCLLFEDKLQNKSCPNPITTRDVIEYATVEGARANGLLDKTGTLTPGKEADVIMLRTDRPNVFPINDPIGAVVWGMDTSNVDSVFVAGKALKRNGELIGVNLQRAKQLAYESRDYVVYKSGFKLPTI